MTKRALITGGQQGIGLGIATALAAAGYDIVIASELPADAEAVQAALGQLGPKARYFQHDLRNIERIPALLDVVGPITTFVSNAGVPAQVRGDMLDMTPDSFDRVMAINLRGGFFLAQAVALCFLRAPSVHYRCICFVTSVSAAMASIERAEYCISKSGAAMMAQLFAARLAADGIGVFELRPGIIETGMTAAVHDAYTTRIEAGLVPARRWGAPADIGSVIVPLAEGAFGFATGAVIPVDGGLSIARF
jgi:NAD(P)-dependent dehydrogenase (short-subunit alcohol dehydrogenase family)